MPIGYDVVVRSYQVAITIGSSMNSKAKDWVHGRKGVLNRLRDADLQGCIWMHCASVGEFEQGLPVLERLREEYPEKRVLVTFFSPSGMNAKGNHPIADHIDYLPIDSKRNAQRFIDSVSPSLALFVKYEFWYHYLKEVSTRSIPTYLISGIFRESQPFFKWYGATHRKMLGFFNRIFVQNTRSSELLSGIDVNSEISGDTRFDRVLKIARSKKEIPLGKAFERASDLTTIVAGSTWPGDESVLLESIGKLKQPTRLIIAPHELGEERLNDLESQLPAPRDRWSHLEQMIKGLFNPKDSGFPQPDIPPNGDPLDVRSLLVDRMGLLSRIYRYGDIAYVGGGFGSGIHNTLEAAAHGVPVLFGPNHERFAEARGLIEAGAGWSIKDSDQLQNMLQQMLDDPQGVRTAGENAKRYVEDNAGATERIVAVIKLRV